jgi:hypothetical protein
MTLTPSSDMDFPAAHSMDTTWFAVDRDGHVGLFYSGEEGAVPTTDVNDFPQHIGVVVEALDRLPVTGEAEFKLSAVLHPGLRSGALPQRESLREGWPTEGMAELEPERYQAEAVAEILLFLDESLLTSEVRVLPGLQVGRAGQFVLVSLTSDVKLARHDPRWGVWADFKRVANAAPAYVTYKTFLRGTRALAHRGVFLYSAYSGGDARCNIPEPYGQQLAPQRPLCLDEAPEQVRDAFASCARLDVSFASSPYIQPVEHVPCAIWGGCVYLASDGFTVRPIPGTDARAYARAAERRWPENEAHYMALVFDPPPDQASS